MVDRSQLMVIDNVASASATSVTSATKVGLKQQEFMVFSVVAFLAKSAFLIRLPYRSLPVNATCTLAILAFFFCYLHFRQKITPPLLVVGCLFMAIGEDVFGNVFHLYGTTIGSFDYDNITHMMGSGLAFVPTFWLMRTTMRKFNQQLPNIMMSLFSATLTFSFCAYYEILELWDEQYFGGKRLWSAQDTPNDLQFDLLGIVIAAFTVNLLYKFIDKRAINQAVVA